MADALLVPHLESLDKNMPVFSCSIQVTNNDYTSEEVLKSQLEYHKKTSGKDEIVIQSVIETNEKTGEMIHYNTYTGHQAPTNASAFVKEFNLILKINSSSYCIKDKAYAYRIEPDFLQGILHYQIFNAEWLFEDCKKLANGNRKSENPWFVYIEKDTRALGANWKTTFESRNKWYTTNNIVEKYFNAVNSLLTNNNKIATLRKEMDFKQYTHA